MVWVQTIKDHLDSLAAEINAATDPRALSDWGWTSPPLRKGDLAAMASNLGARIGKIPKNAIAEDYDPTDICNKIDKLRADVIPHFWNGNATSAYNVYAGTLYWIQCDFDDLLSPELDWETASADGKLPKEILGKLRSYHSLMKKMDLDFGRLAERVQGINEAHEAAMNLPVDMETLRQASVEVSEAKDTAIKNSILARESLEKTNDLLRQIEASSKEATRLVESTEDAYSAATTKGLGEAFQQRADRLAKTMWVWVSGLVLALGVGGWVGSSRVAVLKAALNTDATAGQVSLDLILAFISVAAPVWFAWIATKQIGHRFRLAEDYAFKASVARAYEGYRREAARLDPAFANRLFSTALDRIEEPPIRFVEIETPGMPWQELFRWRDKANDKAAE